MEIYFLHVCLWSWLLPYSMLKRNLFGSIWNGSLLNLMEYVLKKYQCWTEALSKFYILARLRLLIGRPLVDAVNSSRFSLLPPTFTKPYPPPNPWSSSSHTHSTWSMMRELLQKKQNCSCVHLLRPKTGRVTTKAESRETLTGQHLGKKRKSQ